jgi:hypothetical protein
MYVGRYPKTVKICGIWALMYGVRNVAIKKKRKKIKKKKMTRITDNSKLDISHYFTKQGSMKRSIDEYYNDDGDLILEYEIGFVFKNYPANSNIVQMYYSNYCSVEFGEFINAMDAFNKIR